VGFVVVVLPVSVVDEVELGGLLFIKKSLFIVGFFFFRFDVLGGVLF
jgi:hypothetical protein